jgi:flagellin
MALIINTNVSALNAQRSLGVTQSGLEKAIQRLSTGFRINSAADDAAGLAITDRMTAQIRGLSQAVRNANDGVSTLQTADSSIQEITNLLQRGRELAVQSANDTNSSSDRQSLNAELSSILAELDRLSNTVSFNGKKLLDGTFSGAQFQIGANANQTVSFSIKSTQTDDLGAKVMAGAAMSSTGFADFGAGSTITINGVAVTIGAQTTVDGVITAINNRTADTKATATKNAQTVVTDTAFTGLTSAGAVSTLTINSIAIALTTGNADTQSNFVATINQYSNQTGVVAATGSAATHVSFTRASGGDITIGETIAGGTSAVGSAVADGTARTFNAGFTISVDPDQTLVVASSSTGTAVGLTTSVVNTATTSKLVNALSIATASSSNDAIQTIDYALTQVGKIRGDIGAVQNRFTSAISSLQVASENISAARSRIRDTDVAKETAELTRNQILVQAGVSVLAQANQLPQVALSLLGG